MLLSILPCKLAELRGLQGASQADRDIWREFNENWEGLGSESEERFQGLFDNQPPVVHPVLNRRLGSDAIQRKRVSQPPNSTESEAIMKIRLGQSFFRQTVLANYENRCCVTGNPVPQLLVASHILPWSEYPEHRLNPHNGLCLSRTQDAF